MDLNLKEMRRVLPSFTLHRRRRDRIERKRNRIVLTKLRSIEKIGHRNGSALIVVSFGGFHSGHNVFFTKSEVLVSNVIWKVVRTFHLRAWI